METIQTSIVAALVSFLAIHIKFSKNVKLKYITKERQKWREKMRELALQLEKAYCKKDLECVLVEIKVRINAYGMIQEKNGEEILNDSHIWKIIKEIENDIIEYSQCCCLKNNNNIKQRVNTLIEYISLLLKMDWERNKKEAEETGFELKFLIAGGIFYIIVLTIMNFDFFKNNICNSFVIINCDCKCYFIILGLSVIIPVLVIILLWTKLSQKKKSKSLDEIETKYKKTVKKYSEKIQP